MTKMTKKNGDNGSFEESNSSHAYSPGLKIKQYTQLFKERKLPLEGEVLVNVGDLVEYNDIVARTHLPGDPYFIKCSQLLDIEPEEIVHYIKKRKGDFVKKSEVIAKYEAFFGLLKKEVKSPIDGTIESISILTGQVIIRGQPKEVNVNAYIPGMVVEIIPREGVIIETSACFIQGIFGVGGENHGIIKILTDSTDKSLEVDDITENDKGKILVGGSNVTVEALNKAIELGVTGIIVGGIEHSCLREFLGVDIGVAITGEEDISLSLLITEGFGKMAISQKSFKLLKKFEGQLACINGATQIRAGVLRPEIIIPHTEKMVDSSNDDPSSLITIGTIVRIIAEPYFGLIGKVTLLPVPLQVLESESSVRVLNVELENGDMVQVPRANIEIIEE